MLNNYSVKSRLTVLAAVPLIILLLVTWVALQEMQLLNRGINSLYLDRVQPLQQIKQVSDAYAVTAVDTLHKYRAQIIDSSAASANISQALNTAEKAWQSYKLTELTAEESNLVAEADRRMLPFLAAIAQYQARISANSLRADNADAFNQALYQVADPLSSALDKLIILQLQEADKFRQLAEQEYASFQLMFGVILTAVFIALALLSLFIYRSIQHPLRLLQGSIVAVGSDLDLRIRAQVCGKDEIAATSQALNTTLERLQLFFNELGQAISQLAAASEQMSCISEQVSSTAMEQEQKSNLIATAVTQMSAAIQEVANSALRTSEQANEADGYSKDGFERIMQNMRSIEQLSNTLTDAGGVIGQLNTESEKITQVLAVIRTIAEQTNLLALNAAIEAARAGDAGRGFAVVADEVRQLATNTQKATESIKGMIDNLQTSSKQAVSSMDDSKRFADTSVENANGAATVIEQIKNAVGAIVDMNVQISTATEQQTIVAEDISKNISEFTVSISEVTHSARQSAQASDMLAQLAAKLQSQAAVFKV
ncbi:methyl-accepting chemotaxis protein [Rheinheimera maricola]|uniref:Methyl-accepting chemotaxis protein n=1 Tax=Rheinheimera maricola TaxID=2793282 RepID=A0ABS7XBT9_9GAMM|nr:methyl-accepting chemotaxis protein [Rheinheimera maricola]MBZ9612816.1 methyl-accepting chemotaxis protein [Rheinheimera maricola]